MASSGDTIVTSRVMASRIFMLESPRIAPSWNPTERSGLCSVPDVGDMPERCGGFEKPLESKAGSCRDFYAIRRASIRARLSGLSRATPQKLAIWPPTPADHRIVRTGRLVGTITVTCELGRERSNIQSKKRLLPDPTEMFKEASGASWRAVEIGNPYLSHQNHQRHR